uniref:Uncharacterized protein n=1 Tax=Ciona intestinalis TaxID=7719 RepID=F6VSF8_CIOIN
MLRMLNASSTDQLIISPTYVEDISTVSSKCKALGSQPTFHFNLTDCPAVYKSNGTHLSVTYVIRNKAGFNRPSVVQRFKDIAMNITCDFKTQEMINFAQIIPEIQKFKFPNISSWTVRHRLWVLQFQQFL